ncbi:MAG: DUF4416 family protein [Candidatus Omnitrophota bacterium]
MAKIKKYNLVKLIIGFIYKDEAIFMSAKKKLMRKFGKIDFESKELQFNHTDHYQAEMGQGLKRKFVSFVKLVPAKNLPKIKLQSNRLETKFLMAQARQINIDPGYLNSAKLVLATTKDYAHRIYLQRGIFAEVTLSFKGHSFEPNPWSYTDYCSQEYIEIFNQIRKLYLPVK